MRLSFVLEVAGTIVRSDSDNVSGSRSTIGLFAAMFSGENSRASASRSVSDW
jgi:hypothetical protein